MTTQEAANQLLAFLGTTKTGVTGTDLNQSENLAIAPDSAQEIKTPTVAAPDEKAGTPRSNAI